MLPNNVCIHNLTKLNILQTHSKHSPLESFDGGKLMMYKVEVMWFILYTYIFPIRTLSSSNFPSRLLERKPDWVCLFPGFHVHHSSSRNPCFRSPIFHRIVIRLFVIELLRILEKSAWRNSLPVFDLVGKKPTQSLGRNLHNLLILLNMFDNFFCL